MTYPDLANLGILLLGPAAAAIGLLMVVLLYGYRRFAGLTTPYSRAQELVRLVIIAVPIAATTIAMGQRWWAVLIAMSLAVLSAWGHHSLPLEVPAKLPDPPRTEPDDDDPEVEVRL